MSESNYYPAVTDLISVDSIPESLGFLKEGLTSVFGHLYYKDLYMGNSPSRDYGYISMKLVLPKKLALEIPAANGLAFVLNPDHEDSSISTISISFEYNWPIIGLINDFDPKEFVEGPEAWFNLFMDITGLDVSVLLERMIEVFIPDADGLKTFVEEFSKVDLSLDDDSDLEDVSNIISQIEDAGLDVVVELIEHFIKVVDDPEEQLERVKEVFMTWLGDFSWDTIKELLIPFVAASLNEIRVGLEFPRTLLIPIDEKGERIEDESVNSLLSFDVGGISFNTVDGLEFHESYNFNFQRSEILGTGLILEVENLKLDLSDTENIAPATNDGRDVAFKGVYIESASLSLPAFWQKNEDEGRAKIVGSNLLIGSEGGLSGTIALQADESGGDKSDVLAFDLPGDCTLKLHNFGLTFSKNAISGVDINGTLIISGLQDDEGKDKEISIDIDYNEGAYVISADTSEGIPVNFAGAKLLLQEFELSFDKNGINGSSISGRLELDNVKDTEGNDAEIEFSLELNNEGFIIHIEEKEGVVLNIPGVMDITVYRLDLGYQNKVAFFDLKSDFEILLDAPLFGKYIPDNINFESFYLDSSGTVKDVSISATWSDLEDVEFSANDEGATLLVPMNATILDAVTISAVELSLMKSEESGVDLEVLLSGGFSLGPIDAVVSDTGIKAHLDYNDNGGTIGPLDLDVAFVPPSGVGLSIDTELVKGGGYLYFNPDKGEYAGVGEISIKEVLTVSAIAIITTKPPAGAEEPGFSLLLIVAAEFPAIQLGFGFTLNGVGGLFAANRDTDLEALRNGVSNGTINNIMFPEDPVANAPQIIDQLGTVFPLESGAFTFGIMAKLGWGTPTLISLEAGLIVKVPDPFKIAIIGVLESVLPSKDLQILTLVVSFAGTVDTENQLITFDASLNGSQLLGMRLNGEMAFRLRWGNDQMFLLSVGGFHPEYHPPQVNLPSTFRRVSLEIFKDNPRLTLSGYFAITPNTLQFGASVDLYLKKGKFNITGFTHFNTLIQFNPFYLTVSIDAGLSVKWSNMELLGVDFGGSLKGPSPWIAHGYAEFRVVIKIKVKVDVTVGDKKETSLPDIEVLELLLNELDIDKNYEAVTEGRNLLADTRYKEDDIRIKDLKLVHPTGKLKFEQLKVPLNVKLEKIGTRYVKGQDNFSLELLSNDELISTDFTEGNFAPGEFFDLSMSQKLSRPSFEEYDSGLITSDSDILISAGVECEQNYEVEIVDGEDEVERNPSKPIGIEDFNRFKSFSRIRTQTPHLMSGVKITEPVKVAKPELALAYDGKTVEGQFTSFEKVYTEKLSVIVSGEYNRQEVIPNYELFE